MFDNICFYRLEFRRIGRRVFVNKHIGRSLYNRVQLCVYELDDVRRVLPKMHPPGLIESKLAVRHADIDKVVRTHVAKNPGEQALSALDGCIKDGFHVIGASVFRLLLGKLQHVVVSLQDGVLPSLIIFPRGEGLDRERSLESGA